MSVNIGQRQCRECLSEVYLTGPWRPGDHFEEVRARARDSWPDLLTMHFAHARCCNCGTPYLAWRCRCDGSQGDWIPGPHEFTDLSYRHSFNDEPGAFDEPMHTPDPRKESVEWNRAIEMEENWLRCAAKSSKIDWYKGPKFVRMEQPPDAEFNHA